MNNFDKNEIIRKLKDTTIFDNVPVINQEQFNLVVDELIKDAEKELMYRLCCVYLDYNFNKIIDYYVKEKSSYYIEELICFTDGNLDQNYLVKKMLDTKDKIFIKETLEICGKSMQYSMDKKLLEILLDYIKTI